MASNFTEEYREATHQFLDLVSSLRPEDLDKSDGEGWNPRQVIHHLADSEAQSYARLRRLLAEPGTIIQGYDEGLWANNSTLGYTTREIATSVAVFTAVRQASYELLCDVTEEQLDNACTHTESGEYSVRNWLRSYTRHPLDHSEQIRSKLGK
jgi:hypothetical protein